MNKFIDIKYKICDKLEQRIGMYTALEPSPASAGTNNIIMANTSSTLCSSSNTGSGLGSNNSPSNLTFYQRPLSSPLQSVHSLHHLSNNPHSSNQLHPPPIVLSPPLQLTSTSTSGLTDVVIKPSPSPTPGMVTTESMPREDDTDTFTSSSCLYNLDTIQTAASPSSGGTDPLLRPSNMYLQHCGGENQTTQDAMDINSTSDIPSTILMPSEYNNHHNSGGNPTSMESQSSQLSNHQYPSHISHLHHSTNPLDLHDHQKRINNNNTMVSSYNVVPTNTTTAAFTPSPSSDSHCESPTTPNIHSLPNVGGIKGSRLLSSVNGNDRHLEHHGCDERDMLSPSAITTSLTPYHMVGSPTTSNFIGTTMLDIGVGKNHLAVTHPKTPQGKDGHSLENGSTSSLTPPNSATHLRKDCSTAYGSGHLTHTPTVANDEEIMMHVSTTSTAVGGSFTNYSNPPPNSNLGVAKRIRSTSSTLPGNTSGNSTLYSTCSTASISPSSVSVGSRATSGIQRGGHFVFTPGQIDCISDSLQQRRDYRMLEQFLQDYSSNDQPGSGSTNITTARNTNLNSESVVRGMAAVAYENGNYRELYQIIESREFDAAHHEELQRIWYEAHYKEAEGVRGRPLGKNIHSFYLLTRCYIS